MEANRLIEILADGQFHSGESLGQRLNVSRTAVWKQIKQLENMGLRIHSVKGRGYRMADSLELLSGERIRSALDESAAQLFTAIDIQAEVASTNDEVKNRGRESAPYVCFAEMQSSGRGRRGRNWVSPYGSNIYMSVAWVFPEMTGSMDGLSLCVGIAVADAVRKLGIEGVGLKWPNDLICRQQKVAGILLELEGELSGPMRVIIGIGINVAMTEAEGVEIDQSWTSLKNIANHEVSRNQLAAQLLIELAEVLPRFQEKGFVDFLQRWHQLDALRDSPVVLSMSNQQIVGQAKGVTAAGELLIENETGTHPYRGGEVSVRVAGA